MKKFEAVSQNYLNILRERAKKSRIFKPHQQTGLTLAELLDDPKHKSLYMRLSKLHNNEVLIRLARNLAERKNIKNKGAYFMKMFKNLRNTN